MIKTYYNTVVTITFLKITNKIVFCLSGEDSTKFKLLFSTFFKLTRGENVLIWVPWVDSTKFNCRSTGSENSWRFEILLSTTDWNKNIRIQSFFW